MPICVLTGLRAVAITALLIVGLPSAPGAQTRDDVITSLVDGSLSRQVASDPDAAIARIDGLLRLVADDPRVAFDLLSLRAQALAALNQGAAQAATLRDMALFAMRHRTTLDEDPLPLLGDAETLLLETGETRAARQVADLIDQELRAAGLTAPEPEPILIPAQPNPFPGTPPPPPRSQATRGEDGTFEVVEVFYATDRAPTGDRRPARFFGGDRGALSYGTVEVTIPANHRAGALEAPSVWRLEFAPDPAKHVVLRSVEPVEKTVFFDRIKTRLQTTNRAEAIVFVHGYNVSFGGAAKRAAQLAYDTGFPGVPILYSWPSRGSTAGYIADTAVVRLSGRRLAGFLEDIVQELGATTIHLVAHSMGNRAMTDALELFALKHGAEQGPPFGQIIFAAPDLDAGLFGAMMPTIRPLAQRITLYGSENDWALVASRKLHGDAPRAGEGGADSLALAEVDTIDMSDLGEDMLAHSYIANDSSVLLDLVTLFWRNVPPDLRCGLIPSRQTGEITVWKYQKGLCRDDVLIGLLSTLKHSGATSADQVARSLTSVFEPTAVPDDVNAVVNRMIRQ